MHTNKVNRVPSKVPDIFHRSGTLEDPVNLYNSSVNAPITYLKNPEQRAFNDLKYNIIYNKNPENIAIFISK